MKFNFPSYFVNSYSTLPLRIDLVSATMDMRLYVRHLVLNGRTSVIESDWTIPCAAARKKKI